MRDHNLTILTSVLDAATALSIVAHHGNDFLKGHAIKGLHAALIAAEEVRQAMAEAVEAKKAAMKETETEA